MSSSKIKLPEKEQSLSVKKAIRILKAFTYERSEMTIAELVAATGINRTVCYRLLNTLQDDELLEKNEMTGRYRLGLGLFRMGNLGLRSLDIRSVARPEMTRLAAQTSDVVVLLVESGLAALCIERVDGGHPIQSAAAQIGQSLPLHVGGGPFALLAFLPEEKREAALSRQLPRTTSSTITDAAKIRERLEDVRKSGYAVGDEDLVEHLVALGAPIFDVNGDVVASLSVGGIKPRYPQERIDEVARLVVTAADRISEMLGTTRN